MERPPKPTKRKRENGREKSSVTEYTTVKCYLSGIIRESTPDWKENVRTAFENRCVAVSKMMVRGSLLLRLFVDELLLLLEADNDDNLQQWPDFSKNNLYVQILRKGSDVRKLNDGSTHPILQKVWDSDIVQNTIAKDTVKRYVNDYNIINYAAKRLKICFENNLRLHFKTRQERAIRAWLISNGMDKKFTKATQHSINGWRYNSDWLTEEELLELKEKTTAFVTLHRRALGDPETLYTNTCDLRVILKYYSFLKRSFPDVKKIRKFVIVPRHKIGVHYATFDQSGIQGICKELKVWDKEEVAKTEDKLKKQGWHLLLDLEKIKKLKPKWNFHYLETDGIGASILFSRPSFVKQEKPKKIKKISKEPTVAASVSPTAKYVIGIDPGRVNIVTCSVVDIATKKVVRKHRMTAKQYYQESWMTDRRKRVTDRAKIVNKPYKLALEELSSEEEEKDSDAPRRNNFKDYLGRLYANYPVLWAEKIKKKYRKCNMKVYSRKQKCIANFVNQIIPPNSNVTDYHVAFGDAKFAATGKGERFSSPAKLFGKVIRERVGGDIRFSPVNENYTSKVCHRCNQPLNLLEKDCFSTRYVDTDQISTTRRENRNTRRCAMRKSFAVKKSVQRGEEEVVVGCPLGGRYVDRDYNASTNIAHKLMGLWSEELLEKKDKMPLRFYFINKNKRVACV